VYKYELTSWPEVIVVFHGEYKRTVTDTLKFSLPRHAYDGLREPPCRTAETSLPRGGSPWRAGRSSWRTLPPEHIRRQNPLRGPIPETWILTNHQQPDVTTLQRRGCSQIRGIHPFFVPCESHTDITQASAMWNSTLCWYELRDTERDIDSQSRVPRTPIWNPPNQSKTCVMQETVLACVRLLLIVERPKFHITTVLHTRYLPVVVSQVPIINFFEHFMIIIMSVWSLGLKLFFDLLYLVVKLVSLLLFFQCDLIRLRNACLYDI
jgi:hypothetical protein